MKKKTKMTKKTKAIKREPYKFQSGKEEFCKNRMEYMDSSFDEKQYNPDTWVKQRKVPTQTTKGKKVDSHTVSGIRKDQKFKGLKEAFNVSASRVDNALSTGDSNKLRKLQKAGAIADRLIMALEYSEDVAVEDVLSWLEINHPQLNQSQRNEIALAVGRYLK